MTDTDRLDKLELALLAGAEVVTDNERSARALIFIEQEDDGGVPLWGVCGCGNLREAIDLMPEATL